MKPTDRQKMCGNCDGRVAIEAMVCPYCSADLARAPEADPHRDLGAKHQAIQDSLTSLYTPPYQQKGAKATPAESKGKKMESSSQSRGEFRGEPRSESRVAPPAHHGGLPTPAVAARDPAQEKVAKTTLIAILTLSLGSLLFILGILQLFFAEEGFLRLEWDASLWFIYCLAALPLLYYGYRRSSQEE
jgi:hypothetical protein